jgi:hypothetical protein
MLTILAITQPPSTMVPYPPMLPRLLNITSNPTNTTMHAINTPESTTTAFSSSGSNQGGLIWGIIFGLIGLLLILYIIWSCYKGRHRRAARRQARARDPRTPMSFNIRNRASYGDLSRRCGQRNPTDVEMAERVEQTRQEWQQQARLPLRLYQQPHPQQLYPVRLDRVELPRAPDQAVTQGQRRVRDSEGRWEEIELGEAREERVRRVRASGLRELKLGPVDISEPFNPKGSLWPIVKP